MAKDKRSKLHIKETPRVNISDDGKVEVDINNIANAYIENYAVYNFDVNSLLEDTNQNPEIIGRIFSGFANQVDRKDEADLHIKLQETEQKLGTNLEDARYMLKGELFLEDELYERAIENFGNAIKENKFNEWAWAKRGLAKAHYYSERMPDIIELEKKLIEEFKKCGKWDEICNETSPGLWDERNFLIKTIDSIRRVRANYKLGKHAELARKNFVELFTSLDSYSQNLLNYEEPYEDINTAITLTPTNQEIGKIKRQITDLLSKTNGSRMKENLNKIISFMDHYDDSN